MSDIVFKIGPRINASGRMQNGTEAVDLLEERDLQKALTAATHVNEQNERRKDVAKQMLKNGKVELCAFDGQQWLRLAATAVWEDSVPAQEHMLQGYPQLRAMYTPGDGNSAVFWLKDATATFASFTAPPRTVTF